MNSPRLSVASLMIASLLLVVGCQDADRPELVEVSGTLTYKGETIEGGTIFFQQGTDRPSTSPIGAGGKFTMLYAADAPGVKPGENKVYVELDAPNPDDPAPSKAMQQMIDEFGEATSTYKVNITEPQTDLKIDLGGESGS